MIELLAAGYPERFLFLSAVTMFFAGMGICTLGMLVQHLKRTSPILSKVTGIAGTICVFIIVKFADNFRVIPLPVLGFNMPFGLPMALAFALGVMVSVLIFKLINKSQ